MQREGYSALIGSLLGWHLDSAIFIHYRYFITAKKDSRAQINFEVLKSFFLTVENILFKDH